MLASGHEGAVAFAQPDLGLPADVLDDLGLFFEAQLHMAADLRRIAVGPGAFHERASGMGIPSFGNRPLLAPLTRGIFRRDQAQEFHEFSWGIKPGEVAYCGDHGDGHRAWHTPERLQGFDHRVQTPSLDVLVEFLVETLEARGVFGDRPDIFLKDELLRRGRADHCREPPEMGWAPMGWARVAAIVAEQERFEAKLRVFQIAEGIFTGPAEVADGFVFHRGDRDRGEVARACQPGQLHGVSPVRFDAVTSFSGNEGGRHHPAVVVFFSGDTDRASSHRGQPQRQR